MFTDYLGSILKVVDGNGNTKEEQSFDAWGRKRNPANWQVYDAPEDALPITLTWLNRGYTGHEHLYQFGIINMNNRLYDPIVGRMLALDNFVADAESTQAFNRYSYAMNNPLKFVDPSGEFAHLIVGAVIGGLFNWAMNGAQFNLQELGYYAVGAAAGALGAGVGAAITGSIGSLGFISGAQIGSATGFAGGFVNGFGNSLVGGSSFTDALGSGFKSGFIGGAIGGITGGIAGGLNAVYGDTGRTRNFWTGKDAGRGRNPFAFNNKDKKFNAWRSKDKYLGKTKYTEDLYNYSSNKLGGNHVRFHQNDDGGLVPRIENYTYENNGIIEYYVSRFKGRADFQFLQEGTNDVIIRVDGNVVFPDSNGYIPIYEGTKTISVHAIQNNFFTNPINNNILISPVKYRIEGYIKY